MLISKQSGFSGVLIISLIVVAAALGFIGWRIHESAQKANQTQQAQQPQPANPPQKAGNVIKINELGVELTVPDSLKDLTYAIEETNEAKLAAISTASLTTKDQNCSSAGDAPPLGKLFIREGQYPTEATYEHGHLIKQFATRYLSWQSPQSICSENADVESLTMTLRKDLQQSFEGAKESDK